VQSHVFAIEHFPKLFSYASFITYRAFHGASANQAVQRIRSPVLDEGIFSLLVPVCSFFQYYSFIERPVAGRFVVAERKLCPNVRVNVGERNLAISYIL